jgi:hypothetical protein
MGQIQTPVIGGGEGARISEVEARGVAELEETGEGR